MKKILIVLAIVILYLSLTKQNQVIIPKEVIRFRVIAASSSPKDQAIKKILVHDLTTNIKDLNLFSKDLESSRQKIKDSIPSFNKTITETLERENYTKSYKINYGMNYFPEKEYKGIKYEEGEYESLVVTLGDGLGENFWCILFPPLCLLEGEEQDKDEIEYTSFIKEIINKYF